MSIKLKITIFITSLVILSLGITLFYLSNYQYKPALENEIINSIIKNLEIYEISIKKYLRGIGDKTIEQINRDIRKVLDNSVELLYIKILDYENKNRYIIFRKNTISLVMNGKHLHSELKDYQIIKSRIKKIKDEELNNKIRTAAELYIYNDYKIKFSKFINDFKVINSNFNSFYKLKNTIIQSNNKIKKSKVRLTVKKQQVKRLIYYANNEKRKIKKYTSEDNKKRDK